MNVSLLRWIGLIFFAIAAISAPSVAEQISLKLIVSGGNPNQGDVLMSLFDSRAAYMKDPLIEKSVPVDSKGIATVTITDIEPGVFAISVVYDVNRNGELDTNIIGIPTEPYGFSNNATAQFGPPDFDEAKFELGAKGGEIEIYLDTAE